MLTVSRLSDMKIIGLTGQSGSGKGEIARILSEHGTAHIDCDNVYHSLLYSGSECTSELALHFGKEILDTDGSVNRSKLAAAVFGENGSAEKLDMLNRITHKYVIRKCMSLIEEYKEQGYKALVIDAPALIESGLHKKCDSVIAVCAPKEIRLDRIIARDRISREKAEDRLNAQHPEGFYTEHADIVINNSGSKDELRQRITKLIVEILN